MREHGGLFLEIYTSSGIPLKEKLDQMKNEKTSSGIVDITAILAAGIIRMKKKGKLKSK